jgi:hypothetical protein
LNGSTEGRVTGVRADELPVHRRVNAAAGLPHRDSDDSLSARADWPDDEAHPQPGAPGPAPIGRYDDWLPITEFVETHGAMKGSRQIHWALPQPPDVALAWR